MAIVLKQEIIKQESPRISDDDGNNKITNTGIFCKVCNQPTDRRIRCGVVCCEACKKFFQRNRTLGDSLRCISGMHNCSLSTDRAAVTIAGTVWRLVCPRCRLDKCLEVGMRVLGRKMKPRSNKTAQRQQPSIAELSNQSEADNNSVLERTAISSTPQSSSYGSQQHLEMISRQPIDLARISNEEFLQKTVQAGDKFRAKMDLLPLKTQIADFSNDTKTWLEAIKHHELVVRHASVLGNEIPGCDALDADDRSVLFANAATPLSVTQSLNSVSPMSMNNVNGQAFIRFFPEFAYMENETQCVNGTLRKWDPSHTEYCLLMVLIIFQNHPSLSNPDLVKEIVRRLNTVYQMMLSQQFPNDPAAVEERIAELAFIVDLILKTTVKRKETFAAIAARRPDIAAKGHIYAKVNGGSH